MDRTEYFLAIITFLLASIVYVIGDGDTPSIIVLPVLVLLYGTPIYRLIASMSDLSQGSDQQ
ncbi:hypothetical protein SAMN04489841_4238 [Natrinema salaciae]|uniref:Uncharacterized protein n=1 Tax=Natrinema salaciae TaxID=1186196 RepID=A0A1H9R0F4_9EURY|nr:hypothetical protein SAMN04489841_4238 [Natrinema salaciae]